MGKIAHGSYEHQLNWDISESAAGIPLGRGRAAPRRRPTPARRGVNRQGGIKLAWNPTNHTDEQEPDGATARRIVQIIEQNKSKPFFIGCGFHKPHLPWVAPRKYFDMYSLDAASSCPTRPPTTATTSRPSRYTSTAATSR